MAHTDTEYRNQPTLFDAFDAAAMAPPMSRKSDPQTSKDAEPLQSNRRYLGQLFVDQVYLAKEPPTASEVGARAAATHPGVKAESVRKRAHELLEDAEIEIAGERICSVGGRRARTYKPKQR